MSSSPRSTESDESADIELEFNSPDQVEELLSQLVEKLNDVMLELEIYEAIDDDIQELREKMLDRYEFDTLAQAYEALGETKTVEGLREQSAECDERIEELQESLGDMDINEKLKEHFFELYEIEIRKETLECQIKACDKYLEKCKRRKAAQEKKAKIRPASPRRYNKAASPSRLAPRSDTPPRKDTTPTPPPAPKPAPVKLAPVPVVALPEPAPVKTESSSSLPPPPPTFKGGLLNLRGRKKV